MRTVGVRVGCLVRATSEPLPGVLQQAAAPAAFRERRFGIARMAAI